jgi:IclR family acetate operon transcriptional repressor
MPRAASAKDNGEERYHVRSVDRALSILRLFLVGEKEYSLSDISSRIHLPPSTAFRLLVTLKGSGLIEQNEQKGRYRLGTTSLALGGAFLRHSDLRQSAKSHLEALRDFSGETVHLAILNKNEVIYLDKLSGLHPIGLMSSRVGDRAPAHCTGLGKALLSQLAEDELRARFADVGLTRFTARTITDLQQLVADLAATRARGYAMDVEEHEPGVACVAAPIFDPGGIVAAVSVAGPRQRILDRITSGNLADRVRATAAEISARLGGGQGAKSRPQSAREAPGS